MQAVRLWPRCLADLDRFTDHDVTRENCVADGELYKTRTAWKKASPKAFRAASEGGWIDDIIAPRLDLSNYDDQYFIEIARELHLSGTRRLKGFSDRKNSVYCRRAAY